MIYIANFTLIQWVRYWSGIKGWRGDFEQTCIQRRRKIIREKVNQRKKRYEKRTTQAFFPLSNGFLCRLARPWMQIINATDMQMVNKKLGHGCR